MMNKHLCSISWEADLGYSDVNFMWSKFPETISKVIQRYVPVCKQNKMKHPCWMTRGTTKACKRKVKMCRKYSKSGLNTDFVEYKRVLYKTTAQFRKAKLSFEQKLVAGIKSNPKSFYSFVRSKSRCRDKVGSLIGKYGAMIADDKVMCDELNEYFSSVFTAEDLI